MLANTMQAGCLLVVELHACLERSPLVSHRPVRARKHTSSAALMHQAATTLSPATCVQALPGDAAAAAALSAEAEAKALAEVAQLEADLDAEALAAQLETEVRFLSPLTPLKALQEEAQHSTAPALVSIPKLRRGPKLRS